MEQSSVFRVNCMDCLDRTNVVQAAIARSVINNLVSIILPPLTGCLYAQKYTNTNNLGLLNSSFIVCGLLKSFCRGVLSFKYTSHDKVKGKKVPFHGELFP